MTYVEPLKADLPPERLGPMGDVPKVNCTSCHQGAFKPLYGKSQLSDFRPELTAGAAPAAPAAAPKQTGSTPAKK
jgi:photosynthetic reaction center cytochrome c subunit